MTSGRTLSKQPTVMTPNVILILVLRAAAMIVGMRKLVFGVKRLSVSLKECVRHFPSRLRGKV